jgi:hypothetical protein
MQKLRPLDVCILAFVFIYSMFPSYLGVRVGGVIFNVPRALTLLMIALIFIEIAINGRTISRISRVCRHSGGSILLVAGYLGFRFASAYASDDASASFNAAVSEIIVSAVFLYLGMYFVRTLDRFDRLIVIMVGAAGVLCVLGVVEAALQRNVVAAAFPMLEITDDDFLRIALADKLRGTYRVQSTFFHPLAFASYLVLLMPLAIYCLQRAKSAGRRTVYLIVIGLMGLDAFYTGSRAALMIIGIIAFVYWARFSMNLLSTGSHLRRAFGVTSLCIILVAAIGSIPVARHLVKGQNQDEKSSSSARVVQLERGGEAILDHPVLGVGPRMAGRYAGIKDSYGNTVDNWYLTIAVESGPGAFCCFVGMLTAMAFMARRIRLSHPLSERIRQLSYAIEIGIAVFGLFLLILSLHDETFPYLFLLMGGLMSLRDLSVLARQRSVDCSGRAAVGMTMVPRHMSRFLP